MKLPKQDITLSRRAPLYEANARTVLRIKVASARLMSRNVNVLPPHAAACVNSSKVTYARWIRWERRVPAADRGFLFVTNTRPAHPTLFLSLPLSHTFSNSLHPAGCPNRKVPPGRSFSWGPHRTAVIDTKSQTRKQRK